MVKFNDQQLEAINFYKGACGVVAGAGSGKSTVLLNRINNLVTKYNENQRDILAITFTSKTANELKTKLADMGLSGVNVGTFHAICLRVLIKEGIDVRGRLVPEWMVENWFKEIDKKPNTKEIMSFIGYQKNYMKKPEDDFVPKASDYSEEDLRRFYQLYETKKNQEGYYDFDDYLLLALDVMQKNKHKYTFEFVLVDEHQDSNLVQNMILQEICPSGNIMAVGDPRQSIYEFRAGNVKFFMNFSKYWKDAKIINLYMNYRSTKNIVDKSNAFIKPYFEGYEHYVDSEANSQEEGEVELGTYFDEAEEAIAIVDRIERMIENNVKPKEIAVLYRLNSQSVYVENELKRRGIEYDITNDGSFFKRKEVDAIINYLRLIKNSHDDGAMEFIFKFRTFPLKFFSNKLFDKIRHYSGINDMSLYEALINVKYEKAWQAKSANEFYDTINRLRLQHDKGIGVSKLIDNIVKAFDIVGYIEDKYNDEFDRRDRLKSLEVLKTFVKNNNLEQFISFVYNNNTNKKKTKNKNVVQLMTVHASKGLEWDNVFLIGVKDGEFPHERTKLDEEARLFYVGVTRSKENLYLSQIGSGNMFIEQYFGE